MIPLLLLIFLTPLAVRAAYLPFEQRPVRWSEADWSSIGALPPAKAAPEARILVLNGRTGGWKGVFAVHSWIVVKRAGAAAWTRYDVVGWGTPLRRNNFPPDGRWFGDPPRIVADLTGLAAEALIPRIEAAVAAYPHRRAGDYQVWPGPNSNTFVAHVLRAVPELDAQLAPNAVGRDWRDGLHAGFTDSRTGVEINLAGIVGFKLGWVEGIEFNLLGLVAGLDLRRPALKLPGVGRLDLALLAGARADALVR